MSGWGHLKFVFEYLLRVAVGVGLFIAISAAALAVHRWVAILSGHGLPAFLATLFEGVALLLLFADVSCFSVYIVRTTWDFIRKTWRQ